MQNGRTALVLAVERGYANIAKSLLQNRATMDFEDKVRRTDMIIIILKQSLLGLERITSQCQ